MFKDDHSAAVITPPRRRWRNWLLLLGTLALIGAIWIVQVNSNLQSAIAEADRLDPRWRMEEIESDRATPPTGQNAADKIAAIQRLKPAGWPDINKVQLLSVVSPERQLDDPQKTALRELLEPAGELMAEARSLIDTPHGRMNISYAPNWLGTLLAKMQEHRQATLFLRFDVFDKAQAGDADGAVRSSRAAFHVACAIGDQPDLLAQLVRVASQRAAIGLVERSLAQGEPSEAVLSALQARLEMAEAEPLLLYALRGERAENNQIFDAVIDGTIPAAAIFGGGAGALSTLDNIRLHIPGFIASQRGRYLHYVNEAVEIAKLPPEQWTESFAAQDANAKELPVMVAALVGAEGKMVSAALRNHAFMRCTIVAVAAERFRRARGQWPGTPDDLVKAGLLKAVPNDPFAAGQRIKFARRADALSIYSTGPDGADNGGKLDSDPSKAGADLGFRLWDVNARRQPPLPPQPETP